jgi:hypothetical protein
MRILHACAMAVLVAGPAVLEQQPATPEKPPVTVLTGCLKSSGADTAVAGPSGRIYTLEVTELPPAKPATAESTPPGASTTTYSLSAAESIGLDKHVDHKVELTGTLQAPSTTAAAASATQPASPPKPGGGHRTFQVSALKMVAAKCP